MPTITVILQGQSMMAVHDVYDYPIVLQFGEQTAYNQAFWVIPTMSQRIPAWRLSEIRVQGGSLDVLVDGPDGFRYGPMATDWVRSYYPRGRDFALIRLDHATHSRSGVTVTARNFGLQVDDLDASMGTGPSELPPEA